jgi:hypothetical protein
MTRERLRNRRECLTLEFQHAGQAFRLSAGHFGDGRLAETAISAAIDILAEAP